MADRTARTPGGVHDHGPDEGPGTSCAEYLVGACRLATAGGESAEAVEFLAWIDRNGGDGDLDWACRECRPGSTMIVDGFRCVVHAARARLAAIRRGAAA